MVPDEPASAGDDDLLPGDAAGNRDGGGELLDGRGDVLAILGGDPPADGDGDESGSKTNSMEERVNELQLQVATNAIKIRDQITNHEGLVSSINNGLSKFSNFFTRLNEDAANSFSTSGLIMYNGKNFSNKQKLKDVIMKNISKTYHLMTILQF